MNIERLVTNVRISRESEPPHTIEFEKNESDRVLIKISRGSVYEDILISLDDLKKAIDKL